MAYSINTGMILVLNLTFKLVNEEALGPILAISEISDVYL